MPTAERPVVTALDLILQNGGCRGVSLRQIAAGALTAYRRRA